MSVVYEPSKWAKDRRDEGKLWGCPGLASVVAEARKLGYTARVDIGYEGDEDYWQEVNSRTVVMAVNEVDQCSVSLDKDDTSVGMLVIPSNGEDWLCDYHVADWLEKLINKHVYKEQ